MRSINLAVFCCAIVWTLASPANADETWVCTYQGALSREPEIYRFEAKGAQVIRTGGEKSKTYGLLLNDDYGMVAALAETNTSAPSVACVGAEVILIHKKQRTFLMFGGTFGPGFGTGSEFGRTNGNCVINNPN
jgi:hypothetical protein